MQNTSSDKSSYFADRFNIKTKSPAVNMSIYFIIAAFILMGIAVYFNTSISGLSLNNETVNIINNDYHVSYNSSSSDISLPAKTTEKTHSVKISRHMNADELAGNYIAFYAYNAAATVYIDDTEVLNEPDIIDNLGFARPSHWYFIQVPEQGFDLTIDLKSQLNIKNIMNITSGTKSALIYHILGEHAFQLIIGFLASISGLVIIISSYIINADLNRRLRWLGLISTTAGIWTLCNSTALQIFYSHGTLRSYIGYCCYFMFPIIIIGFLLTFEYFNKEMYMHIMYWTSVAALALIFILQMNGLIIVSNVLWLVHIEIIAITLSAVITYIRNRTNIDRKDLDIFLSFIFILFFLTLDVIRYYYDRSAYGRIKFSVYGIIFLLIYFTFSIFHIIKENFVQSTRNAIYEELAFTDAMTMVNNRSAFELAMENERTNSTEGGYILIADLNNLKNVNDNYGHRFGDEAIINTARLINDNFKKIGKCYRIGGDEFCVLALDTDKDTLINCLNNFHNAVNAMDTTTSYPYSVATGYGIIDDSGIDNCFKIVDAIMYANKVKSKKGRQ